LSFCPFSFGHCVVSFRFTDSAYHFGIFKLFLNNYKYLRPNGGVGKWKFVWESKILCAFTRGQVGFEINYEALTDKLLTNFIT
jgi:hypothetical protein